MAKRIRELRTDVTQWTMVWVRARAETRQTREPVPIAGRCQGANCWLVPRLLADAMADAVATAGAGRSCGMRPLGLPMA